MTPAEANDANVETETNPLKKAIPKRPKVREFAGCSLLKEYELLEKIGEGTFGVVHRARQKRTREMVALKRILMHNEKDGFPITALREIKVLKMLAHPNVIRLADMTVERGDKAKKKRGSIFMVTPYMDHDLCGLLGNPQVKFSVPQIKCYAKQLLEGTRYLHSMRILHRDMKAANLLISNDGILQIADFGLARMLHEEPPPGEAAREYTNMVVTRWYRPPELLLGERRYLPAIDIWGIGCILAEMYNGGPILQGSSDLDQLGKIFALCGSPTEANMPGWTKLPGCEGIRSFKECTRQLEDKYAEYGTEMVSLLGKLLDLNPVTRITAAEALEHEYFTSEPLPASPSDLPTYETSHEIDKRKSNAPRAPDAAGQMVAGNGNAQAMAARESGPPALDSANRDRRDYSREPDYSRRSQGRDSYRDRPRDYDRPWYDDRSRRDDRRDDRSRGWTRDDYRSRDNRSRERDRYGRRSPRDDRDQRYNGDVDRGRRAPIRDYYDDRRSRRPEAQDRDRERDRDGNRDVARDRQRTRSKSRDGSR